MMEKNILPENFDFGVPSVDIVECGRKGLDKTAMLKRASAFDDIIGDIKPKPNRTYLHVITTGAQEYYGSNRNGDDFPETNQHVVFPYPENDKKASYDTDGGLKKYHDKTYMDKAAVYQEHHTKDTDPSGEIIAAKYNDEMHRGELLIAVDTEKWHDRLEKKASGQDIFLSMGCRVSHDTCFPAGTLVHTSMGYKPIEDVVVGDLVYADDNTLCRVEHTMSRMVAEKVRIDVQGIPLELECTPNHPFLCADVHELHSCWGSVTHGKYKDIKMPRRHTPDMNTGKCLVCGKQIQPQLEWRAAEDLRYRDFLVAKVEQCADVSRVGTDFAYLCGQYVGDGCLTKANSGHYDQGEAYIVGISISASAAERDTDIVQRIKDAFRHVSGKDISVIAESGGKKAYIVSCHDQLTAVRIHEGFGAGSRMKHISAVHTWSREERLAFLGGYIDADGCIDSAYGSIRICTVNRGLALEVQQICWSVGIPATVNVGSSEKNMRDNSVFGSAGPCYSVYMPYSIDKIKAYSAKADRVGGDFNTKQHYRTSLVLAKDYVYLPIVEVRRFSCPDYVVYNMEVADRHTYYAEGVIVHNCRVCGRMAKTASEHCDHFNKMRCQVMDDGTQCSVINDSPHFYDISGVDVPADRIAFVLRKVASGEQVKEASLEAVSVKGYRRPMLLTKSAQILEKMSQLEKKIEGFVEGDKHDDEEDDTFRDDDEAQKDFTLRVEKFPADEVIDSCSRKGILLSPGMLFKLIGKEMEGDEGKTLCECDDDSCGDCSAMMRELKDDEDIRDAHLLDGSFDQHFTPDLSLENILEEFMPEFSMRDPEVKSRSMHIIIIGRRPQHQSKEASFNADAQKALRRTYARYFISFAEQNNEATCMNALRKIAGYGKR